MNYINNDTILELNKFIESIVEQYKIDNITLKFKPITQAKLKELQNLKGELVAGLNKSKKHGYAYIVIMNLDTSELTIYSLATNLDIEYDMVEEALNSIVKEVDFENVLMDTLLSNSRIASSGLTQQRKFKELFINVKIMRFKGNNFHSAVYLTNIFSYLDTIEEVYMEDCDFNDLRSTSDWFTSSSIRKAFIKNCNMINLESTVSMFSSCRELEEVDISGIEQSTKLHSMSHMFINCYKLKNVKGLKNLKTKQISTIDHTFSECRELEEIDFSNVDFKRLKRARGTFEGCIKLKELHIENFGRSTGINDITDILKDTPANINIYLDKPVEIKATNSYTLTSHINEISPIKKYIKVTNKDITNGLLSNITHALVYTLSLSENKQMISDNQVINYYSASYFDTITIRKLSEADKEKFISKLKILQEPFYDMAGYMITWTQDSLNLIVDELRLNKQDLEFYNKVEYHPELKEVILYPIKLKFRNTI